MPQFMQDQSSNNYDININVPIDPSNLEENTATLQITDGVLDSVLQLENGILNLPNVSDALNQATRFNDNGKGYATAVSIDLTNLTYYSSMPEIDNGNDGNVIPVNENNVEITLLDDNNNKTNIEHTVVPYNPNPTKRSIKAVNLSKDNNMRDITDNDIVGYIRVNIPPPKINSPTTNNGFYKFNDSWNALTEGSSEDHDLIIQVPNSTETLTATQNNHTYTPTQGNVGFSSVTVEVPQPSVESTKTINITENKTTIVTPSSNYDSIGRLEIVTAIPSNVNNQILTTITSNGTYTPDSGYSGFNSFTVNVPQPLIQQNKSITLNSNDTFTINPDNNYDALGQITITTEVPTTDTVINNQNVNNRNLITRNGFYAPDSQHTGFNAFTVAVPLQKDKNINVNGKIGQTIVWTPDAGYEGFEKTVINVIPPAYQTKTITNNGTYTPDSNYDGFSSVTVSVPSSGIQANKLESINFSDFTYINDSDFNHMTINNHIYIAIEDMDTHWGFYQYTGDNSGHQYHNDVYYYYDLTANNKSYPQYWTLYNNNVEVVSGLHFDEFMTNINKQLITGLRSSSQPDEPVDPIPPSQPLVQASTCQLYDPTELSPSRLLSLNQFNKLSSSGNVMIVVSEGDIGVMIEENESLYRFTLIGEGNSVSPSLNNLTNSWYATVENHNYTEMIIPEENYQYGPTWHFEFDLIDDYAEIRKDEIELIGLPN